MNWNENLIMLNKSGVVGNCPFCHSDDTDYLYYLRKGGRGSLDLWCNLCKERINVSCIYIPENRKFVDVNQTLNVVVGASV